MKLEYWSGCVITADQTLQTTANITAQKMIDGLLKIFDNGDQRNGPTASPRTEEVSYNTIVS